LIINNTANIRKK